MMRIKIEKELYSRKVLLKTCYKFTDDYYVHLSSDIDNYYIEIESKDEENDDDIEKEIHNELIEQAMRELVFEETKNIREILFARAMASSMIYDSDDEKIDTDVYDDSAMKDWFDRNE